MDGVGGILVFGYRSLFWHFYASVFFSYLSSPTAFVCLTQVDFVVSFCQPSLLPLLRSFLSPFIPPAVYLALDHHPIVNSIGWGLAR